MLSGIAPSQRPRRREEKIVDDCRPWMCGYRLHSKCSKGIPVMLVHAPMPGTRAEQKPRGIYSHEPSRRPGAHNRPVQLRVLSPFNQELQELHARLARRGALQKLHRIKHRSRTRARSRAHPPGERWRCLASPRGARRFAMELGATPTRHIDTNTLSCTSVHARKRKLGKGVSLRLLPLSDHPTQRVVWEDTSVVELAPCQRTRRLGREPTLDRRPLV